MENIHRAVTKQENDLKSYLAEKILDTQLNFTKTKLQIRPPRNSICQTILVDRIRALEACKLKRRELTFQDKGETYILTSVARVQKPTLYERNCLFPSKEAYLLYELELCAADKLRHPQVVLGSPEEAAFILQMVMTWHPKVIDRLSPLLQRAWKANENIAKLYWHFTQSAPSTTRARFGRFNRLLNFWNEKHGKTMTFNSIADMICSFTDYPELEQTVDKTATRLLMTMHFQREPPSTLKTTKAALNNLFSLLQWKPNAKWEIISKATRQTTLQNYQPRGGLNLTEWQQLTKASFYVKWEYHGMWPQPRNTLLIWNLTMYSTIWLWMLAGLRPGEALNLMENIHAHKISDGVLIGLVETKTLRMTAQKAQIITLGTSEAHQWNASFHLDNLKRCKDVLTRNHPTKRPKTLFFNPVTLQPWTKRTFSMYWEALKTTCTNKNRSWENTPELTLYTFRKTLINISVELGIPQDKVMAITRHKSAKTLNQYYEKQVQHLRGKAWAQAATNAL